MQGATTITTRLADGLYTEALLLADETRAYLDGRANQERGALDPHARVILACEGLNATTRLTQSLAALIARRAGASAAPECLDEIVVSDPDELSLLPSEAQRLFTAGQDLFSRVRRLGIAPPPAAHNPARALLHRLERAI